MYNVFLKNGEKRWVSQREARLLQRQGKLICVLEIMADEFESENLHFNSGHYLSDASTVLQS